MLLILILGALAALVLFAGWRKPLFARGEWRLGAGLAAVAVMTVAAVVAVRGAYGKGALVAALAVGLAWLARSPRPGPTLSEAEARGILGVAQGATAADIRAAHARLIRRVHPDAGGSSGLAAQLNAARDRLLKR